MSAKKTTAVILTAILASLSLSACSGDPQAPTGFVTASGDAASYCFFVPDDWTVDVTTGATSAYFSNTDPSSVSVMTWDLPNTDTTLAEWWDMNMEDIQMVFRDVELISETDATLDGVYAKTYVYNATLGEYQYTIQQTAALKDMAVYLVTYTSLADTFDTHEAEVSEMLDFFTFR